MPSGRLARCALLSTLALAGWLAPSALAADLPPAPPAPPTPAAAYSADHVIVVFAPQASTADRSGARSDAKTTALRGLGSTRFQLLDPRPGQSAGDAVAALRADPNVVAVSRDVLRAPSSLPDDRYFPLQWGLRNTGAGINGVSPSPANAGKDIDVVPAWNVTVGTPGTIVAVLDTGFRFQHPDLEDVVWTNPSPSFLDLHGADFVGSDSEDREVDGDPTDDDLLDGGHGVHTAGIIAAQGNNTIGITGVAQNVRLMPLRVCSPDGDGKESCPDSAIIEAINYAGAHGARVANISLGGPTPDDAVRDALASNPGTLFVIAAGNGDTFGNGMDDDVTPQYPCSIDPATATAIPGRIDNVVCVAATDQSDARARFSNWGRTSVDIAAPGTEIASTYISRSVWSETFSGPTSLSGWSGSGFSLSSSPPLSSSGLTSTPQPANTTRVITTPAITVTAPPAPTTDTSCTLSFWRKYAPASGDSFTYEAIVDDVEQGKTTAVNPQAGTYPLSFTVPTHTAGAHSVQLQFTYTRGGNNPATAGVWLDDMNLACNVPPGEEDAEQSYAYLQGTSMAAPMVSGAAALLFSARPDATVTQVKQALLSTVDPIPDLHPVTGAHPIVSGGRLDTWHALALLASLPVTPESADATTTTTATTPSVTQPAPLPIDRTSAPAADDQPPLLSRVTAAASRFTARKGTTLAFTSSEAARLRYTVQKVTTGRRVGSRCLKASRANRTRRACALAVVSGHGATTVVAGRNRVGFAGRMAGRPLKPGRYRITLVATDAAGNASRPRTLTVTVRAAKG